MRYSMDLQRKIYYWLQRLCPPALLPYILILVVMLRYLMQTQARMLVKKNLNLKGQGSGKDAYLIATGPSLKSEDLEFLYDKDVFTVSNFILHDQLQIVAPRMHCFAPYHPPLVLEEYVEWLRIADERLPKQTVIVLGVSTKNIVDKYNLFQNREIVYLMLEKALASFFKEIDITKPVLSPQSSPIMVLPILAYMGYERVFLLGCDHNILRNYGDVVENFYDNDKDTRQNATSGDNWKDGIINHLTYARNVFSQYKFYQDCLLQKKVAMFNTSKSSWLDFVPYYDLHDCRTRK